MPLAIGTLQDQLPRVYKTLLSIDITAITDIIAGLDEIHQAKIFHRDLKPSNVLKFHENGPVNIKFAISDFGLIAMSETSLSALTTTGMAKGADYYTAPEVTQDLRNASAQSDIYSLGCILHDMVGERPRIPCAEIRDDGPYGAIMRNATRGDPCRRFDSVRSFLDAVMSIAGSDAQIDITIASVSLREIIQDEAIGIIQWSQLIEHLEDSSDKDDCRLILLKLKFDQIKYLIQIDKTLSDRLANIYGEWVLSSSFDFSRCDVIANILGLFIENCSFEAKADCLIALLEMGTSHNRWYVERMFMRLCGHEMPEDLAKRMCIEFRARAKIVCKAVSHLERSLGASRNSLHPALVQVLKEICP